MMMVSVLYMTNMLKTNMLNWIFIVLTKTETTIHI